MVVNQFVYFDSYVLCLLFGASVSEGLAFLDVLSTLYIAGLYSMYMCIFLVIAKSAK